MVEPRIAAAAGIAVNSTKKSSQDIHKAMENAVHQCIQEGVSDPVEVKRRVHLARNNAREAAGLRRKAMP